VHFYVSGYDTEAIYPWWEFESGLSARPRTYAERVSYEGERLKECIDGVRAVAEVHLRHKAPASFRTAEQIDLLLAHARRVGATPCSSRQVYERVVESRSLASEHPPWAGVAAGT
jgi:hypothetical protein